MSPSGAKYEIIPPQQSRRKSNGVACDTHGPSSSIGVESESPSYSSTIPEVESGEAVFPPPKPESTISPSMCIRSIIADAFSPFATGSYSNWRRESRLWATSRDGVPITSMLARLIAVSPESTRVDATTYMADAEHSSQSRLIGPIFRLLDERFGSTNAENPGNGYPNSTSSRNDRKKLPKNSGHAPTVHSPM